MVAGTEAEPGWWRRLGVCVRERRWPWTIQRIALAVPWLRYGSWRHPVLTFRLARATWCGETAQRKGLMLRIQGPGLLGDTLAVCRSLGLRPFLVCGTLLGHYRDGGWIPHDDDVDLGLLASEFQRRAEIVEAMRRRGYVVRANDAYLVSFHRPGLPAVFLDICSFYERDGRIAFSIEEPEQGRRYTYHFPRGIFEEFRAVRFLGRFDVWIPVRTEEFLTVAYGDWRVPQTAFDYHSSPRNLVVERLEA